MAITRAQKAGSGIGGALGGAATGATLGSIVPGIGTLIGAGVGGVGGLLSGLLSSGKTRNQIAKEKNYPVGSVQNPGGGDTGEGIQSYNKFSPEQQQALNSILQRSMSGLGNNNFDFGAIENQARSNFNQTTVPGIAERFSSLGTGGSQRSSAFGQTLGAAGAGLEGNLAAMKQDYGLDQQNFLARLLGVGLEPQIERYREQQGDQGSFGKNALERLLTGENFDRLGKYLEGRNSAKISMAKLGETIHGLQAPAPQNYFSGGSGNFSNSANPLQASGNYYNNFSQLQSLYKI